MRRIAGLTAALVVLVAADAGAATFSYYTPPSGHGVSNFGVALDAGGKVWFSASSPTVAGQPVVSLMKLDPTAAVEGTSAGIVTFPAPDPVSVSCCANQMRGLTFNPVDGKLYYVRSDGGVGRAAPAALVTPGSSTGIEAAAPDVNERADLWDVAPAPGGGAFFTEHSASNVGPWYAGARVTFWNGAFTRGPNVAIQGDNTALSSSRYDAKPAGVDVDASGRPWFTEESAGLPGYRIARWPGNTSKVYDEWEITPCAPAGPCSGSNTGPGVTDLTIDNGGKVWFANAQKKTFGRFDPGTAQMEQFALTSLDATLAPGTPRRIETAPDGTVWLTVSHSAFGGTANALVQINPGTTPTATVYKLPGDRVPLGLAAAPDGTLWFGAATATPGNLIGRLGGVVPPPDGDPGDPPGPIGTGVGTLPPPGGGTAPSITPTPVTLKPATVGTARLSPPSTDNGAINTNQICVGPPEAKCSVIYMIREREYVAGWPSVNGKSKKKKAKKPKPRVLGQKTVTLRGGQRAKVTVKLNRLGKRILKGEKKLKVIFTASEKLANGKTKTLSRKTLTMRP